MCDRFCLFSLHVDNHVHAAFGGFISSVSEGWVVLCKEDIMA